MYTMLPKYQNIPHHVAIVDCTHIGSATASAEDLVTLEENTTEDILVEDQLLPPLNMAMVDQERELHKPNS